MIKIILVTIAILTTLSTFYYQEDTYWQFLEFKKTYNKVYSEQENQLRYRNFLENMKIVKAHNEQSNTYKLTLNQFSDLTQEEFQYRYLNIEVLDEAVEYMKEQYVEQDIEPVDWRGTIRVRNQGSCGNSQVFSSLEAVEGLYTVGKNQKVQASIQQIIDCAGVGCEGGSVDSILQYIQKNGIATEQEYPGNLSPGTCKKAGGSIKISGYNQLSGENLIQQAVAQYPISALVDATTWASYSSGIFSNCDQNLNHAILIVGYDAQGNWIVQNSWGVSWGQSGYIKLKAGDTCGITKFAYQSLKLLSEIIYRNRYANQIRVQESIGLNNIIILSKKISSIYNQILTM
ncbi:hypothetical protein pb186bvf_018528 [Paramecium bursaria]